MAEKHGSLSINSENIFPIIKKWLYSDHDIFVKRADFQWLRCNYEVKEAGCYGRVYIFQINIKQKYT